MPQDWRVPFALRKLVGRHGVVCHAALRAP